MPSTFIARSIRNETERERARDKVIMMELGGAREAREQKSKKIKLLQNYS